MKKKQRKDYETLKLTKKMRTDILIKENRTFNKKKRSGLRYNSKETRTKIVISNIHETWETIVYKRLSRRSTS